MKVGDLVSYRRLHFVRGLSPVGVVLKTPEKTGCGSPAPELCRNLACGCDKFEVRFNDITRFCRGKLLEIVSESS